MKCLPPGPMAAKTVKIIAIPLPEKKMPAEPVKKIITIPLPKKMPAEPVKSIDKSISIPLTKQQQGERAKGLMVPSPSTVGIAFSAAAAKACWGRGVSPLEILQLPYDDVDLNGRWAAAIMAAAAM